MNFTFIFFGLIFISAGILFACGRLHGYIKEWNKMSYEERRKIKIVPLCRNIGSMIALAGIVFLISGFMENLREQYFVIMMVIWMVLSAVDLVLIEKKHLYDTDSEKGGH